MTYDLSPAHIRKNYRPSIVVDVELALVFSGASLIGEKHRSFAALLKAFLTLVVCVQSLCRRMGCVGRIPTCILKTCHRTQPASSEAIAPKGFSMVIVLARL